MVSPFNDDDFAPELKFLAELEAINRVEAELIESAHREWLAEQAPIFEALDQALAEEVAFVQGAST